MIFMLVILMIFLHTDAELHSRPGQTCQGAQAQEGKPKKEWSKDTVQHAEDLLAAVAARPF